MTRGNCELRNCAADISAADKAPSCHRGANRVVTLGIPESTTHEKGNAELCGGSPHRIYVLRVKVPNPEVLNCSNMTVLGCSSAGVKVTEGSQTFVKGTCAANTFPS